MKSASHVAMQRALGERKGRGLNIKILVEPDELMDPEGEEDALLNGALEGEEAPEGDELEAAADADTKELGLAPEATPLKDSAGLQGEAGAEGEDGMIEKALSGGHPMLGKGSIAARLRGKLGK